ncbi:hypothetical protein [Streptomyces sp. NPDC005805]|uniref:hypothetical protein n=1 Tax=Streptomyces sp. NPDC005805 TaxID=3157068 RepID=UPI0033CA7F97
MQNFASGAAGSCAAEGWPLLYLGTVAVLGGLGLLVNLLALYASIFATDDCGTGAASASFRCTTAGRLTMYALPWAGLVVAVVAATGLGVAAVNRGDSPWWFLLAGAGAHLAGLAGACAVMLPGVRRARSGSDI